MAKRLLVGIPLALLMVGLLLLDGYLAAHLPDVRMPGWNIDVSTWLRNGAASTALIVVLTVLATDELVHLARARGYRPFGGTAVFFAAVLVVSPYVSFNVRHVTGAYDESWSLLWMATALAYVFLRQAVRRRTENAMENIAITIFIIFYAGGLAGFLTKLRMELGGSAGVLVVLFSAFLVKMADTGAYFAGRAVGRHKLIPWLSPGKTWEGFAGGLATTILLAVLIGQWLHAVGWVRIEERYVSHVWALAFLGLLLGLFSVAGDLCESLLKRDAAVKDSGRVPGLGGVLDMVDSVLLAAPVAWLFWTRLVHLES
ncbi:MAG: CDP-archaeol synthase [Planctomycetota bacterium]